MTTDKTPATSARTYRQHIEFSEKHPAEMKLALAVMNRWQRGEVTLAQAIAEAIMAERAGANISTPSVKTTTTHRTVQRRTR